MKKTNTLFAFGFVMIIGLSQIALAGPTILIAPTTITGDPNSLVNGLDSDIFRYTVNPTGTTTPGAAFSVNNILTNTGYQFNATNVGTYITSTGSGSVTYGYPPAYPDQIPLTTFLGGSPTISGDALTISYTNNELSYPNTNVFDPSNDKTGTLLYVTGYTYIPASLVGVTLTYSTLSDDGAELIINGTQVLNNPGVHPASTDTQTVNYSAPGLYSVVIGYYDADSGHAQFGFTFSGGTFLYPNVFTTVNPGLNQSWNTISNWSSSIDPNNAIPNSITNIANLAPVSTASSVDLGGNSYTVNQLNVQSGGSTGWTVQNGSLYFDGTNPIYSDQSSTGGNVLSINVGLNQTTQFNIGASGGTNISGSISNGFNGAAGITKTGAGTLTLSGNNTYTGATLLNAGTLNVGSAGALSSATVISFNGGTLQYSSANQIDYSNQFSTANGQLYSIDTNGQNVTFASNLISNGGSLTKLGNGTLTLTAANTYTNGTAINGGTLSISNDNNLGLSSGGVTLSGGELLTTTTLGTGRTVTLGSGTDSLAALTGTTGTYSGQVSGNGALTIGDTTGNDNGKVILTNTSNNYTGGTAINVGSTLQVGDGATSNGSIGSGTVTDNGVFMLNPATASTISNSIVGSGSLTKSGPGTTILTGANDYSGGTTINATGILQIGDGLTSNGALGTGAVVNSGTLVLDPVTKSTISNSIAGSGSLVKSGTGTSVLSGSNTYGGGTLVAGGTLSVSSNNNLGAVSGGVALMGGGELLSTNTFNTDRSVTLGAGGGSLAASTGTAGTYSTSITGNGPLVIGDGTGGDIGTVILTGTSNSYTGGTSIASGSTLQIGDGVTSNGSIAPGTVADNGIFALDPATGAVVSNQITGTGALTKSGSGITILNNSNTYSGGTTITGGTLIAATSSAFGTGNVANSGEIETGGYNRRIDIGGNFQQSASGSLILTFNNAGYDAVNITGPGKSSVNGALQVNFSGYTAPRAALGQVQTNAYYPILTTVNGLTHDLAFDPLNEASGVNAGLVYTSNDILLDLTTSGNPGLFTLSDLTPNQLSVGNYINSSLLKGRTDGLIESLGTEITANPTALGEYLDQLSPLKFENFAGTTAFNDDDFLIQEMDNYLAGMRSPDGTFLAKGGLDSSGLVLNNASTAAFENIQNRLDSISTPSNYRTQFGASDPKAMADLHPEVPASDRWNTLIAGNVTLAQSFSNDRAGIAHSDATSEALVLGEDYLWTPHLVTGLLFNYDHTSASLDNIGSSANIDTYAPGFYASYSNHGWYANVLGKYGFNDYSQNRSVALPGIGVARSHPSGHEAMINLDSGYDFHIGKWTVGPAYGVHYTHLNINGYSETGMTSGNLDVADSQGDSFKSWLGARARYEFQSGGMTFTPHASVSWQHEFMNQLQDVNSQFSDLDSGAFNVQLPRTSRDSALMDIGLDAQINHTVTVFGSYFMNAGLNDYFAHNVQVGVKLSF